MIDETMARIEARLKSADSMNDEQRRELRGLFEKLKTELAALQQKDADQARSIAAYLELSAHELTRKQKQPHLLQNAIDGLSKTVLGFEADHPKLTEAVNSLTLTLSRMGI